MSLHLQQTYMVRLKAYNIKQLRNGFLTPYDPVLFHAMMSTMNDLVNMFRARTGYTNQFEIILIFDQTILPMTSTTAVMSLYASTATVRLNYYLVEYLYVRGYDTFYHRSKVEELLDKQTMVVVEHCQTLPEQVNTLRDHIVDRIITKVHFTVCEYMSLLFPSLNQKTKNLDQLLEQLQSIPQFHIPEFVLYGVFAKRNALHHIINQVVGISQASLFTAIQDSTWNTANPIGIVVNSLALYLVPQIKTISTEAGISGLPPPPAPDTQNNTGSQVDSNSSVSSLGHC
jgi:hypothetical protein